MNVDPVPSGAVRNPDTPAAASAAGAILPAKCPSTYAELVGLDCGTGGSTASPWGAREEAE